MINAIKRCTFNWIKDISDILDDLADISAINGSIFAAGSDNVALGNRALACFNATGDLAWNRTRGGAENDGADAICANSSTVYVLGYSNNDLLENPTYPVIDAYGVNGTFLWEVDYAGDYLFLNAIGASNSSVAACGFDRSPATSYDGVVKTFSTTGTALNTIHWGTPGEDNGYAVEFLGTSIISAGRIQVGGTTNHAPFVARFSASGVQSWNWTWATP